MVWLGAQLNLGPDHSTCEAHGKAAVTESKFLSCPYDLSLLSLLLFRSKNKTRIIFHQYLNTHTVCLVARAALPAPTYKFIYVDDITVANSSHLCFV